MIISLGLDVVEIKRFMHWHIYSRKQLRRIFSDEEINYCLHIPVKSAERFAIRLAAKEAFYKALSTAHPNFAIPFITLSSLIHIKKSKNNAPFLEIPWHKILPKESLEKPIEAILSLTHTATTATAIVILQKK